MSIGMTLCSWCVTSPRWPVSDSGIRAFIDSVPCDLMLKAVAYHTDELWFCSTSNGG